MSKISKDQGWTFSEVERQPRDSSRQSTSIITPHRNNIGACTIKVLKGPGIDPSVYGCGNTMEMDLVFRTWRFHGWWAKDAYPLGNY
ncbi:uncharacterized protein EAF02_007563 [Botrytis sinoallii]|uniref:uncharacterized protein n=1 Tax=Botrytis sinoallii TaxID=1463999 RepID=UPI0019029A6B|nr:uncharacterized protein EAF02_007563 [Botrytis sinoallii]KAF7879926.1 hypothetical protein EAF02_007563 [Botrytis sinoallii]